MNKRGISPLIAIVLIIAFTVAIVALIIMWVNTTYHEIEESVGERTASELTCARLIKLSVKSSCVLDRIDLSRLDNLRVLMENKKRSDIEGFTFRLIGERGVKLVSDDRELNVYEVKLYDIDIEGDIGEIGIPYEFQIIPNVTIGDVEYTCAYRGDESIYPIHVCALIEDFDDGDSGYWGEAFYSTPASFAVENSEHQPCNVGVENCEFSLDSSAEVAQAFADSNYDDVIIEADVIFKQDYSGQSDAGVMARYTDAYHWYQVRLDKGNGNIIYFGKKRPEGHINIGSQVNLPFEIEYDVSYRLKFILVGNRLMGYVDGVKYLDYTDNDNPYTYGDIGLKVWQMHAHFDNVEVRDYDA